MLLCCPSTRSNRKNTWSSAFRIRPEATSRIPPDLPKGDLPGPIHFEKKPGQLPEGNRIVLVEDDGVLAASSFTFVISTGISPSDTIILVFGELAS